MLEIKVDVALHICNLEHAKVVKLPFELEVYMHCCLFKVIRKTKMDLCFVAMSVKLTMTSKKKLHYIHDFT